MDSHSLSNVLETMQAIDLAVTPKDLLAIAQTYSHVGCGSDQRLRAGAVTLDAFFVEQCNYLDYFGEGSSGLYCLSFEDAGPMRHSVSPSNGWVHAFYLPVTAKSLDDVQVLFEYDPASDPRAKRVLDRMDDTDIEGPVEMLGEALRDAVDLNIEVARNAIAAHARGTWCRPPTVAFPEITVQLEALLSFDFL